jgi:hypothetical protein
LPPCRMSSMKLARPAPASSSRRTDPCAVHQQHAGVQHLTLALCGFLGCRLSACPSSLLTESWCSECFQVVFSSCYWCWMAKILFVSSVHFSYLSKSWWLCFLALGLAFGIPWEGWHGKQCGRWPSGCF